MDVNKLAGMGLTPSQIQQVISEHNQSLVDSNGIITNEKLQEQRKRDEIMAVEDDDIRQDLIKKNADLFMRKGE